MYICTCIYSSVVRVGHIEEHCRINLYRKCPVTLNPNCVIYKLCREQVRRG